VKKKYPPRLLRGIYPPSPKFGDGCRESYRIKVTRSVDSVAISGPLMARNVYRTWQDIFLVSQLYNSGSMVPIEVLVCHLEFCQYPFMLTFKSIKIK
jgi:hypothetical protein